MNAMQRSWKGSKDLLKLMNIMQRSEGSKDCTKMSIDWRLEERHKHIYIWSI